MKHNNDRLENLARSSSRLNKSVTLLVAMALLLVGLSAWSLQRLIEETQGTMRLHFARLMENIQEQEDFLQALTLHSLQGDLLGDGSHKVRVLTPLPEEGPNIYQGQAFSFSMPFSVKVTADALTAPVLGLGANLADFYSTFWADSYYRSPQVFLFNHQGNYDITVPAAGRGREHGKMMASHERFIDVFNTVFARRPDEQPASTGILWKSYVDTAQGSAPARLLAYVNLDLEPEQMTIKGAGAHITLALLLDLAQINDFERVLDWSIYNRFTLLAPTGEVLIGALDPDSPLHDGLNLRSEGLVFKLNSAQGKDWTAVYTIGFGHFFRAALWPLSAVVATFLALLGLSWLASRWYRRNVIHPARQAHENIAESIAFSRVVIDTAPTGLCVVNQADSQVVMENQRARQWSGTTRLISALQARSQGNSASELPIEIDGRHLEVNLVSTRYQGQDVNLYAFNDVTRHIEDAHALEQAMRAADLANEAKTLFLATMSHEIRTPLYGVLGTLELLGLTPLAPRQQAYLQTIQRSSATLFQLISDVLDVSKIESGQMNIEPVAFAPLEMIEDTLRTYAAFAQRKGLQLYGCTDVTLPERLLGDPLRIRQILNNLLSNAIKFTDAGRVVLRTRVLATSAEEVSLEWQVTDTGIGIDQAEQARLFELFYQAREASGEGGAGLGLPICGWLSEMMGGQLSVVSETGLGSSFCLRMALPVLPSEAANMKAVDPSLAPVQVRAPVPELAHSHCAWLNRLGIPASVAVLPLEPTRADALLVDVLPADTTPNWPGPQVRCTSGGPVPAQPVESGWEVDLHDLRAIARAILQARSAQPEIASAPLPSRNPAPNLHILVAEDNPINQAILKEQLETLGCSAMVAANGELALHLWQPGAFDLVLTDVNMPVMDGYELAIALRELDAQLPIIGVTANAMREEGQRCAAAGMNAWLVKPLSLQTLRAQLIKQCKPASLPETPEPAATSTNSDSIQLSPAMRPLFLSTMQDDLQLIGNALEQGDHKQLGKHLHSVSGALGAVQAIELADRCAALESELGRTGLDAQLALEVRGVMGRMLSILKTMT
ncbi:response regulator [Pseudomonas mosselii]|uniref:hybrid sensor histidine kinase/response regulator n=1 Tax=unclassified Pseudomonas TaxID=196821 RepID=UPI0020C26752|nr:MULTISPECIES: hybrid sensor histidine kinase/response regulator [unclassified Pseudomonas]MCP8633658.1 response regulator [Pseudomonas sp. DVZ6]MDC0687601.1 response regulator [Mitsuaria sp. RG]MDD7785044.1 response regulator [Pseudomonas sp. DVZ24]